MRRLLSALALLAAPFAFALSAAAADEFPRRGAVILLGYNPEATPTAECEKRASIASIVRVALAQDKPPAQRMAIHLNVAGLVGAARAICPANDAPSRPRPLSQGEAKLDAESCRIARDVARGPIAQTISSYIEKEHTDVTTGFVEGVADALAPIARACDPGDYWASLKVEAESLARRAASMKERRRCTVWRSAGFKELGRATDVAASDGRAAGKARLERQAMTAIAGARHYCGEDAIAEAFEKMQYDLAVALINAAPEKPAKK